MAFNRDRNSRGGEFRPGGRPRFNDRGSNRGPVEMHKAICDNCGKECEVPFRPTSGKPIYCSNCFENKRGDSTSRRYDGRNSERSEVRPMFDATCADCGNKCSVPFHPGSDKPIFCSNCFGEKKGNGSRGAEQPKYNEQFAALNTKLDKILEMLTPEVAVEEKVVVTSPSSGSKKKASSKKK